VRETNHLLHRILFNFNGFLGQLISRIDVYLDQLLFYFIALALSEVLIVFQENHITVRVIPTQLIINRLEFYDLFIIVVGRLPFELMHTVNR
jgi:hypothetical protein